MSALRRRPAQLACLVLSLAGAAPAMAQSTPHTPAAGPVIAAPPAPKAVLRLSAVFSAGGETVRSGVTWMVFRADAAAGDLPLAAQSGEAQPSLALAPGPYVVEACYGLATAGVRIEVDRAPLTQRLVLNAGGFKVDATILDQPVPTARLTSRVMAILPGGERRSLADAVPADAVLRLPEGRYFVENTYGDSNAVVSAEIEIHAGRVTEATFHHRAATMTLKLVSQPGGEAIANTSWSVLTPGGDAIRESIGAFPSMILAEGAYTVVARHEGRVYQREFEVKAGQDQDVEVVVR